jgi:hypothetical protein
MIKSKSKKLEVVKENKRKEKYKKKMGRTLVWNFFLIF